jgi:hypothetical protein
MSSPGSRPTGPGIVGRDGRLTPPDAPPATGLVAAAEIATAAARVKRAQDACRTAGRHLAQAQAGSTGEPYAVRTCTTPQDVDAIAGLVGLALVDHERVDVVVLISP